MDSSCSNHRDVYLFATTTPPLIVVREYDGSRAAEYIESLSCSNTKSAGPPIAGIKLRGPGTPIAVRALTVTASWSTH